MRVPEFLQRLQIKHRLFQRLQKKLQPKRKRSGAQRAGTTRLSGMWAPWLWRVVAPLARRFLSGDENRSWLVHHACAKAAAARGRTAGPPRLAVRATPLAAVCAPCSTPSRHTACRAAACRALRMIRHHPLLPVGSQGCASGVAIRDCTDSRHSFRMTSTRPRTRSCTRKRWRTPTPRCTHMQ